MCRMFSKKALQKSERLCWQTAFNPALPLQMRSCALWVMSVFTVKLAGGS